MTIRILPSTTINRIAAGEVVERPASALKELVENSIDAGARRIDISLRDGGRSFLSVSDDGHGMSRDELSLAVERHATSKLDGDDLEHISTLGFRGEALPSIGSVSRLTLTSRIADSENAWSLSVEGGAKSEPVPAAHPPGTTLEVRDLFFATPARLKFLKTPRTELNHAQDAVKRLAMAHPHIAFTFEADGRSLIKLPPAQGDFLSQRLDRLDAIMGNQFAENSLPIDALREDLKLTGFIGLPTLNRGNAQLQFLFVNGRPVRDKLLFGAVRGAYRDFLAHDRHPLLALFLDVAPELVDVNVHPAKNEVRFRDAGLVRGMIVSALKHALADAGHRASTTVGTAALGAMQPQTAGGQGPSYIQGRTLSRGLSEAGVAYQAPLQNFDQAPSARYEAPIEADLAGADWPLGVARAQLHETYIIAQTDNGIVIVDQHAAHERLVYEEMKTALARDGVKRQLLLIPEIVELDEAAAGRIPWPHRQHRWRQPADRVSERGRRLALRDRHPERHGFAQPLDSRGSAYRIPRRYQPRRRHRARWRFAGRRRQRRRPARRTGGTGGHLDLGARLGRCAGQVGHRLPRPRRADAEEHCPPGAGLSRFARRRGG